MELSDFLQANIGLWKAQRTSFYLEASEEQGGRLELTVDWLTNPQALQEILPDAAIPAMALSMDWQGTLVSGTYRGKSTLALVDQENCAYSMQQGQLWTGHYEYISETLTLRLVHKEYQSEERIWLAGKNLRMRALTVQRGEGYTMASFFSEIRSLPPTE